MMGSMTLRRGLPTIVLNWLLNNRAWLIGSGAKSYLMDGDMPRDLDIIVPPDQWQAVCRAIPRDIPIKINNFGGLKVKLEGIEVDVWPQHLDDYIALSPRPGYAVRLGPHISVRFEAGIYLL